MFVGGGPLLDGNYWLEEELPMTPDSELERKSSIPSWPAYDPEGVMEVIPFKNHY